MADAAMQPTEGPMLTATRGLIWIYLVLWIFEGSLRKWFLVSMSNELLVIRDPVVLLIYATAAASRAFRFNLFNACILVIGVLSVVASSIIGASFLVTAFGFRANFLHLPLVFVMAAVLRPSDLKRMGLLILVLAIPMSLVMTKQYRSDFDDWWNLGAGGGRMIIVSDRKVRPSGFFSFISGPIFLYSVSAALIMAAATLRGWFRWWIALPAGAATVLASAMAGSRSLLGALVITLGCFLGGCILYPRSIKQMAKLLTAATLVIGVVSFSSAFKEGSSTTADRFTGANRNEGGLTTTIYERFLKPVVDSVASIVDAPPLGVGLGLGTNAGGALAKGSGFFGETEWSRVVGESGPVLGLLFMFSRVGLIVWLFVHCLGAARKGNLLPMALWGAGSQHFVFGQFGQPTSLGGAVLLTGFCIASLKIPFSESRFSEATPTTLHGQQTPQPVPSAVQQATAPAPSSDRFVQRGTQTNRLSTFDGLPPRRGKKAKPLPSPEELAPPAKELQPVRPAPGAFSIRGRGKN